MTTKLTDIKPDDHYDLSGNEDTTHDVLHHIATQPDPDQYNLRRIAKHPNTSIDTLKHLHNHVHNEENGVDGYDKSRLLNAIYEHPNADQALVHEGLDKLKKEDLASSEFETTMKSPHVAPEKLHEVLNKVTDNDPANINYYSHHHILEAISENKGTTAEHLQPLIDHEDEKIRKTAINSPAATLEQQQSAWKKSPSLDNKRDLLSNTGHLHPQLISDIHDEVSKHLEEKYDNKSPSAVGKDREALRDYVGHHNILRDVMDHPKTPASLLEKYSTGANTDLARAAVQNPSFPKENLQKLVLNNHYDATSALLDRQEDEFDPKIMEHVNSQVKPDKDKYMGSRQRSLLTHKSTPDHILKERANIGAYAANKILTRDNLSPEVLKHLVNHKNKEVALSALKHKNANEDVITTGIKRKMKEVSDYASNHKLAPKKDKYDKFLKTPESALGSVRHSSSNLHDDPEYIQQVAKKYGGKEHHELNARLLSNKHIGPQNFNKLLKDIKNKEANLRNEDGSINKSNRDSLLAFTQHEGNIARNHSNMDAEGRRLMIQMSPMTAEHIDNLSTDEIKEGLSYHKAKNQTQAAEMANGLLFHNNIDSEVAKNIITGQYGPLNPRHKESGSQDSKKNDIKKAIHDKPDVFTPEVIKAGLSVRPEFANPDVLHSLAGSPHLKNEHINWDQFLSENEPEGDDRDSNVKYNAILHGMYTNPNLHPDNLQEGLRNNDFIYDTLNNPSLTNDHIKSFIDKGPHTEDLTTEDYDNLPTKDHGYHPDMAKYLANAVHKRGMSVDALKSTNDPAMARNLHYKIGRDNGTAEFYNKHLPELLKNPNPDIIKDLIEEDNVRYMDRSKRAEAFDTLIDHPDKEIKAKAYQWMGDKKKTEYEDKYGSEDPDIVRGLRKDQLDKIKITPQTNHRIIRAITDNMHATQEHMSDAVNHSKEGAQIAIPHLMHHIGQEPHLTTIRRTDSDEKKEKLKASNKAIKDQFKKRSDVALKHVMTAIEKYPDHDDMIKDIGSRSSRAYDKKSGIKLSEHILNHPKISDEAKGHLLGKSEHEISPKVLDQFKDTKNAEIVNNFLTRPNLKPDPATIKHMADNSTSETAIPLAEKVNFAKNPELLDSILKHSSSAQVAIKLSDNSSVPVDIKKRLLNNPHVALHGYKLGVNDDFLDNILNEHADKDPTLYPKVINHHSCTDDLRSKTVKMIGKKIKAMKEGGENIDDDNSHKELQRALFNAVSIQKNEKFHAEAQQVIGEHGDNTTVSKFLNANRGKTIDDKAAALMYARRHDGVRGSNVEDLLLTRFKNPELSKTLINEAGPAGSFHHIAEHIGKNKLPDDVHDAAYSQLVDASVDNGGYPSDMSNKATLLHNLMQKSHVGITDQLLSTHPDLVHAASANKRINPEKYKEAFHAAISKYAEKGDTHLSGDSFEELVNNPHIESADIDKAYEAIKKSKFMATSTSSGWSKTKQEKLKIELASSSKTSPKILEEMANDRTSGGHDIRSSALRNKNLPVDILKDHIAESIKGEIEGRNGDSIQTSICHNPNAKLSFFKEKIKELTDGLNDEDKTDTIKTDIYASLAGNDNLSPEELSEIYDYGHKMYTQMKDFGGRNSSQLIIEALKSNASTSESVLRNMIKDGYATEDSLIEHPTIGGKIYREKDHPFPSNVPNLQHGNEIHKVEYKPKQEKYKAAIAKMPPEGMDWAAFKKAEPKLAADPDVQKMFTSQPKQRLTKEAGEEFLKNIKGNKFHIAYRHEEGGWTGMQRHDGSTTQLIQQINNSEEHEEELRKNPKLFKLFKFAQKVSRHSQHPVDVHTLGWSRIDTSDPEHWFIDETQSDMNSGLSKILRELEETGNAKSMQQQFGVSPEEAEHLIPKLQEILKNWERAALHNAAELAKKHGVPKISIHSGESKTAFNKAGQEVTNKYNKIYNESANAVGYTKKTPYSELKNHNRDKANNHIWTMDLTGKGDDDIEKSTRSKRESKDIQELMDSLIKFEIGVDGKVVQQRHIDRAKEVAKARSKIKEFSLKHGMDTTFVDRILRNMKKDD